MKDKPKPVFDKRIFWDVVFENIDYDKKASFVIERVFERGDIDDIRNCRRYYGDEKVADALLNAKFLPETRMYLASAVINRPLKDFRCYKLRLSIPTLFHIKSIDENSGVKGFFIGWRPCIVSPIWPQKVR
jgi:hypothetical protein